MVTEHVTRHSEDVCHDWQVGIDSDAKFTHTWLGGQQAGWLAVGANYRDALIISL